MDVWHILFFALVGLCILFCAWNWIFEVHPRISLSSLSATPLKAIAFRCTLKEDSLNDDIRALFQSSSNRIAIKVDHFGNMRPRIDRHCCFHKIK